MNILCKNEVVKSVSEKMGTKMETLIKQVMEIIQSLLILVPPLVVDCFPNPDICCGAYGKSVVSCNAEDYVTTRSALFYSYQGESVAKDGACLSISLITEHPELLRFHDTVNINSHTLLFEIKLLEDNMEGNGIPEGKCSSEVDEKHEMFSGGLIPKKHRNTALSPIQNVTEYTRNKRIQTDETLTSWIQGTNTVPQHLIRSRSMSPQHLIRSRSMSPVRRAKYYNGDHPVTDGRHNLTIAVEKTTVMPPKIRRESEHDKQYHTTVCNMSQARKLLPDKYAIHENRKSFLQTDHAHTTNNKLYQEQFPSATVDINHEPNAVGDKKLVEVRRQSDIKEDNSEEQSDLKKDNSKEQSDPREDNSKEQSDPEKDNSKEQSDPREDNSKEQSDPEKDNSKEQSDPREDNSKEQSDTREDNSKEQSDTREDNSKEQSDQSILSKCTLS